MHCRILDRLARDRRAWAAFMGGLVLLMAAQGARAGETNLLAEFTVRHWSVEDGLPEAVLTSMSQLADGFLWCTTPHHLVRFDGVRFEEYEFDVPGKEQIGQLLGAYRDAQGALWCYGAGGAWRRDSSGWVAVPIHAKSAAPPIIFRLQESPDHTLWAASNIGICRFDGQSFTKLPLPTKNNELPATILSADGDSQGVFWLATAGGLLQFQQGAYHPLMLPPTVAAPAVTRLAVGSGGRLWIIAAGQLYCCRAGVWSRIALPSPELSDPATLTTMREEANGDFWIGALYGVYRLHEGQWSGLTAREGVLFPLDVRCLASDRDGNVWVGTSSGLVRLLRTPLSFFRTGLPWGGESISALLVESPTNFWTAVAGGGLLNGSPGAFHLVHLGSLPENATVSALLRGKDGTLWVGTQGDSLWRVCSNSLAELVEEVPQASFSARGISALLQDSRGHLWVGTWDGLMTVNESGQLAPVLIPNEHGESLVPPADTVHVLYEDREGRVWVGYQSFGLVCIYPDGRIHRFQYSSGSAPDSIRALIEDAEGRFWIGTTHGLVLWNGKERHVFTTSNALVDNVVLQILEDQNGLLWFGTRHGIMRIQKAEFFKVIERRKVSLAMRAFGLESGMGDEECTGGLGAMAAKTPDGRLWFPTMEGIVMADPRRISTSPAAPRVYIENIEADEKPCYTLSLADTSVLTQPFQLRLPRGVRDLEIHFTAPTFSAPERTRFRYCLEGFDHDFSFSTYDRVARYPHLPAGVYHFQVKARDRDGAWSEVSPAVTLNVPPYFWETVWFWILVGAGVTGVAGLAVRAYDQRKIARQLQALEARHAVERERARIARDIHDDVGAGLTEVAMLSELAQDEAAQPGALHGHLDDIFQRARQMTQSLDEIVWAINPANDTLESFISYVGEYAQDFLTAAGVACRLDLPRETPAVVIGASVRHHLCLAVKESLHNIVKHAAATEVLLRVTLTRSELTVSVEDNGRGFVYTTAPGVASGRDGLNNLRTRLREIDGDLQHESRLGTGTRLVMSVRLTTKRSTFKKTTETV